VAYKPINLQQKFLLCTEQWAPKVVAEMNDYQFKIVKLTGDFVWHHHKDTDETFIVVDGSLRIEPRGVPNTGEEGGERTAQNDVWILRAGGFARNASAGQVFAQRGVPSERAVGRLGASDSGRQERSIMEMLDAERENYRSVYLQALCEARGQHDVAMPEVKVHTTLEKFREPYRHYTLDILCRRGDRSGPIEVNLTAASAFAPVSETWQELDVTLHPFVWNGLEFRLDGDLADDARLVAWMDRWMDIGEKKPRDENHLSEIVHNVTQPGRTQGGWSFSVDFGSAPLDAFVELVEVVRASGAKKLELGSFGYPRA
jgi:hypothetical protein